jgi:hypothetical protein
MLSIEILSFGRMYAPANYRNTRMLLSQFVRERLHLSSPSENCSNVSDEVKMRLHVGTTSVVSMTSSELTSFPHAIRLSKIISPYD